jgi:hypothetical protein
MGTSRARAAQPSLSAETVRTTKCTVSLNTELHYGPTAQVLQAHTCIGCSCWSAGSANGATGRSFRSRIEKVKLAGCNTQHHRIYHAASSLSARWLQPERHPCASRLVRVPPRACDTVPGSALRSTARTLGGSSELLLYTVRLSLSGSVSWAATDLPRQQRLSRAQSRHPSARL